MELGGETKITYAPSPVTHQSESNDRFPEENLLEKGCTEEKSVEGKTKESFGKEQMIDNFVVKKIIC